MKKLLVLFLTAAMLLGLCACGESGGTEETQPEKPQGLQVGYSKISITPTYEVGLGGYSDAESRTAQGFIDYIYTICVAVTSGDETILIYTIDNCAAPRDVADPIREVVSPAPPCSATPILPSTGRMWPTGAPRQVWQPWQTGLPLSCSAPRRSMRK